MINDHISSAFFKKTWFNLSTGAVGTVHGDHTASMSDEGNGWYRCSINLTSSITNTTSGQGIYVSPIDLPAISDLDNDGDLDILTFFFRKNFEISKSKNIFTFLANKYKAVDPNKSSANDIKKPISLLNLSIFKAKALPGSGAFCLYTFLCTL